MRGLFAVFKREWWGYVATPLALVFLIVFLASAVAATFYLGGFFEVGQAELRGFFQFLPWLFLFFLPALSMRLWAEERRLGTFDLILSLPIAPSALVLGKFFAVWALACLTLLASTPLWASVLWLGSPDNGVILAGYLGSALLAGCYLAIGLCLSALTRNQLIAFICTIATCFLFMVAGLGVVLDFIKPFASPLVLDTLAGFSFLPHFEGIIGGVIDVRAVAFFASVIIVWLLASLLAIEWHRHSGKKHKSWLRPSFAPAVAVLLLVVIFVASNVFATNALRQYRWDLTQNRLYTLSAGTQNILAELEEPINLQFFFSQEQASQWPLLSLYARRVRDLLEEMSAKSNGALMIETIAPAAFSREEDAALRYGLRGQNNGEGELVYFGLVGANRVDSVEVIPFFSPEREAYLEYDLAQLIYNLAYPEKTTLGVISNLPLDTGAGGIVEAMQKRSQPFLIYEELTDRFNVRFLQPSDNEIASDVDVLLIAHPRKLPQPLLYAIDQFILRGGRALVFLDPYSEVSFTAGADGRPLAGATPSSQLEPLLTQWGVALNQESIIADAERAQRVTNAQDNRRVLADYVVWLGLGEAELNRTELMTAELDRLNLASAGALEHSPDPARQWTPLITSSHQAALLPKEFVQAQPSPDALARRLQEEWEKTPPQKFVIGAKLSGTFASAFAKAPPAPAGEVKNMTPTPHLAQSTRPATIVVVADSDIFDDRLWVEFRPFAEETIAVPMADNAQFLLNAVEVLMGSADLISLRGREPSYRPFTRLEDLRREAEAQFLEQENAIYARVEELRTALRDIDAQGGVLSAELQTAQTDYRQELLRARQALRDVQAALRRDIEWVSQALIALNLIGLPLLVIVLWFALPAVFRRRERKDAR